VLSVRATGASGSRGGTALGAEARDGIIEAVEPWAGGGAPGGGVWGTSGGDCDAPSDAVPRSCTEPRGSTGDALSDAIVLTNRAGICGGRGRSRGRTAAAGASGFGGLVAGVGVLERGGLGAGVGVLARGGFGAGVGALARDGLT